MTTTAFLGIDIAKRKFDAFLQRHQRSYHRQFANTASGFAQLQHWLHPSADGPIHAGMEATSRYGEALALFLHQAGVRISVINPARIHAFAKSQLARNKTDKLDAAVIARFVATQAPAAWTPPALEQRQLQALVRRLDALQAMRQAEQNRLDLEDADSPIRDSLVQHLGHLDEQLRRLRRDLAGHVRTHRDAPTPQSVAPKHPRYRRNHGAEIVGRIARVGRAAQCPRGGCLRRTQPRATLLWQLGTRPQPVEQDRQPAPASRSVPARGGGDPLQSTGTAICPTAVRARQSPHGDCRRSYAQTAARSVRRP